MGGLTNHMDGVTLTPLRRIATPGGDVLHALKSTEPEFDQFGEAYFSMVAPGAIKGWKLHNRMRMNLVVPCGKIAFLVHDARPGSATQGCFLRVILGPDSTETYQRLTVDPGLWMAFAGHGSGNNILLNVASLPHDPDEAENRPLGSFDTSPIAPV